MVKIHRFIIIHNKKKILGTIKLSVAELDYEETQFYWLTIRRVYKCENICFLWLTRP